MTTRRRENVSGNCAPAVVERLVVQQLRMNELKLKGGGLRRHTTLVERGGMTVAFGHPIEMMDAENSRIVTYRTLNVGRGRQILQRRKRHWMGKTSHVTHVVPSLTQFRWGSRIG